MTLGCARVREGERRGQDLFGGDIIDEELHPLLERITGRQGSRKATGGLGKVLDLTTIYGLDECVSVWEITIEGADAHAGAFEWKTIPQGAATAVWAGIVAPADAVGARYCEDCHVAEINDDPGSPVGIRSYALDPERARTLWTRTEEMIGEHF